jgi:hypothetical protein
MLALSVQQAAWNAVMVTPAQLAKTNTTRKAITLAACAPSIIAHFARVTLSVTDVRLAFIFSCQLRLPALLAVARRSMNVP